MMGREDLLKKFWSTVETQLTRNPWFYKKEPFRIGDRRAVKGYRTGALRIDCGIRNEELLGILTTPILYQLTPWNISNIGQPRAYIDRRHVVIESPWPEALQIKDVPLSSLAVHPGNGRTFAIGPNQTGTVITLHLDSLVHLLVAGTTGSGKSWAQRLMACQVAAGSNMILLLDGKGGEGLGILNGLPGQVGPLALSEDDILSALLWALAEMQRRYEIIGQRGGMTFRDDEPDPPHVCIFFDEFQSFTKDAKTSAITQALYNLAAKGRAARIHLFLGTQRPTVNMFGENGTRDQLSTRLGMSVESFEASRAAGFTNPRLDALQLGGDAYIDHRGLGADVLEHVQMAYIPEAEVGRHTGATPTLREWPRMDTTAIERTEGRGRPARILSDLQLAAAIHAARQVPPFGRPAYQELLKRVGDPLPANPVADEAIKQGRKLASLLEEIENKDTACLP